ncbi:MAG: ribosome assembly RNA-binding protein YhbY [Syntrophales bacterium]|nr:ribosome assembly RNA-binding protein YhbY [Syntrophales bacterium]
MIALKGFQKKHLKGLAHGLKPVVQIGKEGITEGIIRAVDEGLFRHELIKIKFTDFKEQKEALTGEIEIKTGSERVGMIGHMVILYRQQADPEKRKIALPQRKMPLAIRVSHS